MSQRQDQTANRKQQQKKARPATAIEIERGLDFLNDYFLGVKAKVKIKVQDSDSQQDQDALGVVFELTGDLKPLKRSPHILSSLTRLTSMAMSAGSRGFVRCSIDLEGRLKARQSLLEVIADDAAAVAKHTHKRAIIEGLNSSERRQVHQFVSRDDEVETLSDGEGEFRYMMVAIKT